MSLPLDMHLKTAIRSSIRRAVTLFVSLCASTLPIAQAQEAQAQPASITDRGSYYEVRLDLRNGLTHRQLGEAYGQELVKAAPQFERLLDSYLAEVSRNKLIYSILLRRTRQIRLSVPQDYKDEIEGIASQLSGGTTNKRGDGKISVDELYMFNLLGDVARLNQCCSLAVFGERSATGSTIVGHNFDWPDGQQNELSKLQCVMTIRSGDKFLTNVACLGFQGAVSAFNNAGIFAAVQDSPTGLHYTAAKMRSFVMDLRQALENAQSIDEVITGLKDSSKQYAFSHLIIVADPKTSMVLENNVSKGSIKHERAVRYCDSKLRDGAVWDISNAIGCVNCFELDSNVDNHIDPLDRKAKREKGAPLPDINTPRWDSIREQLLLCGSKISADDIKHILSFHHGPGVGRIHRGDLYNNFTMESVVFEPATLSLQAAFRPREGGLPATLKFEPIPGQAAQAPKSEARPPG
jgi:hypothetical protein